MTRACSHRRPNQFRTNQCAHKFTSNSTLTRKKKLPTLKRTTECVAAQRAYFILFSDCYYYNECKRACNDDAHIQTQRIN